MGFAVLAAARRAADGGTVAEVAAVATARAAGASVAFYVDTLEHLRRGGRIGAASALLGSALAIKPILTLRAGSIEPLERVRTSSRALARLAELALDAAKRATTVVDVAIQHLDSAPGRRPWPSSCAGPYRPTGWVSSSSASSARSSGRTSARAPSPSW